MLNSKIYFSMKSKGYEFLSNFYPSEINMDGKLYRHVEGYYQSCKYQGYNNDAAEHVRIVKDPGACKRVAYGYRMPKDVELQWHSERKLIVMKQGVLEKFKSNEELKSMLLSTGNSELIEYAPWDNYWGTGPDGEGQNMLGKVLMEVRIKLKEQ